MYTSSLNDVRLIGFFGFLMPYSTLKLNTQLRTNTLHSLFHSHFHTLVIVLYNKRKHSSNYIYLFDK